MKPLSNSRVGNLPKVRTSGKKRFRQLALSDNTGPIKYRHKKLEKKAYILLYSFSLTRAVYLDLSLLPDLSTEDFI